MLTATRDDGPHGHAMHYAHPVLPRTLASRFTGAVQLVGSLVGIPLALIGGYSTYHASFSPEGRCQALRGNIVSMLDKKADATTLRLLVQKDVVTFERECGSVDADAAAAFKTLLASEAGPVVSRRVVPPARGEKVEKTEKIDRAERVEPVKREAVKRETPIKETAAKETATKDAVAKLEPPKQLGMPPHALVAPPSVNESVSTPPEAEAPVEQPKPVEAAAAPPEKASVDATWVASVRDALRESASQPPAGETKPDAGPSPGAPVDISPEPQVARRDFVPPAEMGQWRPSAPRPPASIPNAN